MLQLARRLGLGPRRRAPQVGGALLVRPTGPTAPAPNHRRPCDGGHRVPGRLGRRSAQSDVRAGGPDGRWPAVLLIHDRHAQRLSLLRRVLPRATANSAGHFRAGLWAAVLTRALQSDLVSYCRVDVLIQGDGFFPPEGSLNLLWKFCGTDGAAQQWGAYAIVQNPPPNPRRRRRRPLPQYLRARRRRPRRIRRSRSSRRRRSPGCGGDGGPERLRPRGVARVGGRRDGWSDGRDHADVEPRARHPGGRGPRLLPRAGDHQRLRWRERLRGADCRLAPPLGVIAAYLVRRRLQSATLTFEIVMTPTGGASLAADASATAALTSSLTSALSTAPNTTSISVATPMTTATTATISFTIQGDAADAANAVSTTLSAGTLASTLATSLGVDASALSVSAPQIVLPPRPPPPNPPPFPPPPPSPPYPPSPPPPPPPWNGRAGTAVWGTIKSRTVYDCQYDPDRGAMYCVPRPSGRRLLRCCRRRLHHAARSCCCAENGQGYEYFRKDSLANYGVGDAVTYFYPGIQGEDIHWEPYQAGSRTEYVTAPGKCVTGATLASTLRGASCSLPRRPTRRSRRARRHNHRCRRLHHPPHRRRRCRHHRRRRRRRPTRRRRATAGCGAAMHSSSRTTARTARSQSTRPTSSSAAAARLPRPCTARAA